MKRSLFVAAMLAAVPSFAQEGGVAQFSSPSSSCPNCLSTPSNTIVLDASAGRVVHPLPSSTRSFATTADFANFLQQNLNATPLYDASGNIIGAKGNILRIGRTYYLDSNNNVQVITEPISAFIGGLSATYTVAGVTYQTGVQGQDFLGSQTSAAPTDVYQCNRFGECISGHSWNKHNIGHIYDSVGVEVDQENGGYQENHYFCLKFGFIPWICSSSSGSNQLTLHGSLWAAQPSLYPVKTINQTTPNTTHIELNSWSVCLVGFCGSGGPATAANLIGACEEHSSAAVPSIGATTAGQTGPSCPGPLGVTCSSGYTLCQPSNVCTVVANDTNNCGACGHVCPAGNSCQSGTCVSPPPPPPRTCPPRTIDCNGDGSFCVRPPAVCP